MTEAAPDNRLQSVEAAFAEDGALARAVSGFWPRIQQTRMAQAVTETLASGGRLVVEAGTGTGKTFAYLVPALLSGRKVIISTGTKNLQDQLYHRDLPTVRSALGAPAGMALLKGRQNYLCLQRMEVAAHDPAMSRAGMKALAATRDWAEQTRTGDIAELGALPEQTGIRARITSTADNCLGTQCPRFSECFVVKARRQAQQADIVIVNHHLLLADMALREEGFGEILPGADAVILDEAHQLPDTASSFFGFNLSTRQIHQLIRDTRAENEPFHGETPELDQRLDALEAAVSQLDHAMGAQRYRASWSEWYAQSRHARGLIALSGALDELSELLKALSERSRGLDQCRQRTVIIQARLNSLSEEVDDIADVGEGAGEEPRIRWVENFRQGFALHLTPLRIADTFRRALDSHGAAWIFTSATLSVGGRFTHFTSRLGLDEGIRALALDSPFDFKHNALLYTPPGLPQPNAPQYTRDLVRRILPLLQAAGGGAFVLFTSYRALNEAAELLDRDCDLPLFVQGEADRNELLERFRAAGNGVLLGTSSFWEGVDVRGRALRLVIIDRLPFSSPGDPVLRARLDAMRTRGMEPFMEYQLPQAVVALKQGVGRLIRDRDDRGVLVICDPRLTTRGYGRTFLSSLPELPRTKAEERVCDFLKTISASPTHESAGA